MQRSMWNVRKQLLILTEEIPGLGILELTAPGPGLFFFFFSFANCSLNWLSPPPRPPGAVDLWQAWFGSLWLIGFVADVIDLPGCPFFTSKQILGLSQLSSYTDILRYKIHRIFVRMWHSRLGPFSTYITRSYQETQDREDREDMNGICAQAR
jgi:hypothetical protein